MSSDAVRSTRSDATDDWIVAAFNRLALERRFDEFTVSDVIARAGVGRSTFYEHFRGKEDVLRRAVSGLLAPLADAVGPTGAGDATLAERVRGILEHVREFRAQSSALLAGPAALDVRRRLAELHLERLARRDPPPKMPLPLLAETLAYAQLGLLATWIERPSGADAATVAATIVRTTRAFVDHA
ncbi:MAG: TetR/AcrR family transcriptional regulator [Phycisphaerae bacterium]|nr:TetR/AcrR family transcriptional regulator [Phycisphaerae bacterium]